ncbi:hypothetical protein FB45DRAFT_875923 [Roridomyces roridus]|uniref:Uncharacterized protein n=1 Tax=Roridomyces roridus TaxID=1738132 RepID=A0AAD7B4X6_9AGAR|nr:hypothetical protein FB45DRAFT_875923 [Roridomyces roridus]
MQHLPLCSTKSISPADLRCRGIDRYLSGSFLSLPLSPVRCPGLRYLQRSSVLEYRRSPLTVSMWVRVTIYMYREYSLISAVPDSVKFPGVGVSLRTPAPGPTNISCLRDVHERVEKDDPEPTRG